MNSTISFLRRIAASRWGALALVFCAALLVRLVYLWQVARGAAFQTLVVDAYKYDIMARRLVHGAGMDEGFFLQSPLYPLFLALVYRFNHDSVLVARAVQLLLGCVTCVLIAVLGERLGSRRTGLIAGLLAACYGPMLFYEGELIGAGWDVFWMAALLLLFLRARAGRGRADWAWLGAAGALAILSRPSFAAPILAGGAALAWQWWRERGGGSFAARVACAAAGMTLVMLPWDCVTHEHTGRWGVLPQYGGINFYVGNNPDSARLLLIRPGPDWIRLKQTPARQGIADPAAQQRWFFDTTLDYFRAQPLAFLRGLGWKTLEFICSRETPNSEDLYLYRADSPLLALLAWKLGPFGFPFGVLLPLALVGWALHIRRVGPIVPLLLAAYAAATILIHVCDRYRLPAVAGLIPLAALGAERLVGAVRARRWRCVAPALALCCTSPLLTALPGPFTRELINYPAELAFYRGLEEMSSTEPPNVAAEIAAADFQRALALDPDYANARTELGAALTVAGRPRDAEAPLREVLARHPDFGEAHFELARALNDERQTTASLAEYRRAAELEPGDFRTPYYMGLLLGDLKRYDEAAAQLRAAVRLEPSSGAAHFYLARALSDSGHPDLAADEDRKARDLGFRLPPGK